MYNSRVCPASVLVTAPRDCPDLCRGHLACLFWSFKCMSQHSVLLEALFLTDACKVHTFEEDSSASAQYWFCALRR